MIAFHASLTILLQKSASATYHQSTRMTLKEMLSSLCQHLFHFSLTAASLILPALLLESDCQDWHHSLMSLYLSHLSNLKSPTSCEVQARETGHTSIGE